MTSTIDPHGGDKRSPVSFRGLFARYFTYLASVMGLVLLVGGLANVHFIYRDTRALVDELQREKARSAAFRIEQFVASMESELREALSPQRGAQGSALEAEHVELLRLLRVAPPVRDASWVDKHGIERLRVSRLSSDRIGHALDRSDDPAFRAVMRSRRWAGEVEFHRGTEPYLPLGVADSSASGGALFASIDLRFVRDIVTPIRVGTTGYAYVVDARGRLIVHPDLSLMLQMTDFSSVPAVRAVLHAPAQGSGAGTRIVDENEGRRSVVSSEPIGALGWTTIVTQPVAEAYAPVYDAIVRSAILLVLGLALTFVAAYFLARRMSAPIRRLQHAVARMGEGELDEQVTLDSRDELQALAEQFNRMARQLGESYRELEARIEQRTRQLEDANRSKSRFLAAASHDLRQPMHALGLFVAQLRDEENESVRRQLVEKVAASCASVGALIDALLDISRLDAGAVEPLVKPFALQQVFDRIEQSLGAAAQSRGLRFRLRASAAEVVTDALLLERILLNLCSNAIRYTSEGGIVVGARLRRGHVRIDVWDTGAGIEDADAGRIFEAFYRGTGARGQDASGLGLGLAIVRQLCELLDIEIHVRSKLGRGTVFWLDVPLASARTVTPPPPEGQVHSGLAGLDVLLIDDDPVVLEATAGLLAQWGCRMRVAASGAEAVGLIAGRCDAPQVVICDYHLNGDECGLDIVAELRGAAGTSIPAVIVTADKAIRVDDTFGPTFLLNKPLNAARLRALLHRIAADAAARSNAAPE